MAEVGADVSLLVAIRRPAGAGVAVTEAAGAADGVVGLQIKPAWLAPGHREKTGVRCTGQAELQGTTAVSLCGTLVTAPCEPSSRGPEECGPTALPPSPRLERDSVRVPMPGPRCLRVAQVPLHPLLAGAVPRVGVAGAHTARGVTGAGSGWGEIKAGGEARSHPTAPARGRVPPHLQPPSLRLW